MTAHNKDHELENEIREMLRRRAADIVDDASVGTPESNGSMPSSAAGRATDASRNAPTRGRWLMAAAAGLALTAGVAAAVVISLDGGIDGDGRESVIEAGPAEDVGQTPSDSDSDSDSAAAVEVGFTLEDVLGSLPPSIDLEIAPLVYSNDEGVEADQLVADYLALRLPDLSPTATQVGEADGLIHYRWSYDTADVAASGSVVVRHSSDGERAAGILLSTSDGMTVISADRTDDTATVVVGSDIYDDTLIIADVADLQGTPVPSADADGLFPDIPPPVGTAGSGEGPELRIEQEIAGSVPVVFRAQHLAGTFLSIVEFPLPATGFAQSCGPEAPVSVGLGDRFGPQVDGPYVEAARAPLANQQVWHHPGDIVDLEIRWPADPNLHRLTPADLPDRTYWTSAPFGTPASTAHTVINVGGDGGPCDLIQFTLIGEPEVATWWAGALGDQWSFGFPLDLGSPDLDPSFLEEPALDRPSAEPELVIDTVVSDQVPAVPATGACDGLPDAGPRTGAGPLHPSASSFEALLAFVLTDGSELDPPLGTAGYVEYQVADDDVRYVLPGRSETEAVIVIDLGLVNGDWVVERWSAAAC